MPLALQPAVKETNRLTLQVLTQWAVLGSISYVLLTLTTLGYIIDQR